MRKDFSCPPGEHIVTLLLPCWDNGSGVRAVSVLCLCSVLGLCSLCSVRAVSGLCLGCVWAVSGLCPCCVWALAGLCLCCVRAVSVLCPGCVCALCAVYVLWLGCVWAVLCGLSVLASFLPSSSQSLSSDEQSQSFVSHPETSHHPRRDR